MTDRDPVVPLPEQHNESETKMSGVELIATERQRQIEGESYTPEHDADHHGDEALALAACAYAIPRSARRFKWFDESRQIPTTWPWHADFWKPTPNDRVRELVKAGALIAAEIDRLNSRPTFDFPPGTDPWADLHQGRASS